MIHEHSVFCLIGKDEVSGKFIAHEYYNDKDNGVLIDSGHSYFGNTPGELGERLTRNFSNFVWVAAFSRYNKLTLTEKIRLTVAAWSVPLRDRISGII